MPTACSRGPHHATDATAPTTPVIAIAHRSRLANKARNQKEERARSGKALLGNPLALPRRPAPPRGKLQLQNPPLLLRPSSSPAASQGLPGLGCR